MRWKASTAARSLAGSVVLASTSTLEFGLAENPCRARGGQLEVGAVTAGRRQRALRRRREGSRDDGLRRRIGRRIAQVPGQALHPLGRFRLEAADHRSLVVENGQRDDRLLLLGLGAQRRQGRVGDVALLLDRLLLDLGARLLHRLGRLLEVPGESGAERRIVGGVEGLAEKTVLAIADPRAGDEEQGFAGREEHRLGVELLVVEAAQRLKVIEDVEAAAEGREDEVVLALLDREIAHLDRRQAALQLDPLLAAVGGEEEAELGAGEEEVPVARILDEGVDRAALRQVAGDRDPALAAVGAAAARRA